MHSEYEKTGWPTLYCIDPEQIIRALPPGGNKFEKVEYLKARLEHLDGRINAAKVKKCETYIPALWRGVFEAQYGCVNDTLELDDFQTEIDRESFKQGVKQWDGYCQIKQLISDLEKETFVEHSSDSKKVELNHETEAKPKFTINEIALLMFYKNVCISRHNSDEIAEQFGHTSGHKLYQEYNHWLDKEHRILSEGTARKDKNKLKKFEKIIPELSGTAQERAIQELDVFKRKMKY